MKIFSLLLAIASFTLFSFITDPAILRLYIARMQMSFNQPESKTEVYFFTDWDCPKCKELNSKLMTIAGTLHKQASIYYIDLNPSKAPALTAVNESLLLSKTKELDQYLKIRQILFDLAANDPNPSEEKIKLALEAQKIDWSFPPQDSLQDGLVFFETMKKNFQIDQIPSLLIYNLGNQNHQKLTGEAALNPTGYLEVIAKLQTPSKVDTDNKKSIDQKKAEKI